MDGWEFAAELIKAGAWPFAVMFIAVMFRREIKDILRKIKSLEGPGGTKAILAEQVFAEEAKELANEAKEVSARPPEPAVQAKPIEPHKMPAHASLPSPPVAISMYQDDVLISVPNKFRDFADAMAGGERQRPAADVLLEWQKIQSLMVRVAARKGIPPRQGGPGPLAASLYEHGVIPLEMLHLIQRLRELRNQVAKVQFEPDRAAADDYLASARKVIRYFESLEALDHALVEAAKKEE
jgi:hypothetical protein